MTSAILLYVFVPVEVFTMVLDTRMILLEFTGGGSLEQWRELFLARVQALAGAPLVALLCYYTIVLLAAVQPFPPAFRTHVMKHEDLMEELQAAAAQIGVTLRFERGDFEGGYCILRDQKLLLINKRLMPARKVTVIAVALSEIGLDNVYLKPAVRAFVEDEAARSLRAAQ